LTTLSRSHRYFSKQSLIFVVFLTAHRLLRAQTKQKEDFGDITD
jgi:hypothetical protein